MQALLDGGYMLAADSASADIGLYSLALQAACRQAPEEQIRLLEYDQNSSLDHIALGADILLPVSLPVPFLNHALKQAWRCLLNRITLVYWCVFCKRQGVLLIVMQRRFF